MGKSILKSDQPEEVQDMMNRLNALAQNLKQAGTYQSQLVTCMLPLVRQMENKLSNLRNLNKAMEIRREQKAQEQAQEAARERQALQAQYRNDAESMTDEALAIGVALHENPDYADRDEVWLQAMSEEQLRRQVEVEQAHEAVDDGMQEAEAEEVTDPGPAEADQGPDAEEEVLTPKPGTTA